ncbi:MAG: hypothetical protein BWY43_00524 [candidate division WS2 bacterium ADurb.Bin280]|uniref:TrbL/VirB6 plasmid conjugal transfer protein n=1 Tax=candidate division WS2 bacterium ADurb.Bin280 TaxID=1852829 RepID=A0A1V5SD99_9BACT|nr:MAG: hypothetical protein BWY43_00524 [candidate division WS2 bacterium ADurb.Bin280]
MMKKKLFIFTAFALFLFLPFSLANAASSTGTYQNGIKNWEKKTSPIVAGQSIDPKEICDEMFAADEKNLFKDVICSLSRVIAASTSQFSTEMTCKIQQAPTKSNYVAVDFEYKNGSCQATSSSSNSSEIFGSKTGSSPLAQTAPTGLYTGKSILTSDLAANEQGTKKAFNALAWVLSIGALLALLVYAFSSILNIEINTYSFKKALPRTIGALIGGWVSLSVIILLSRFVDFFYRFNIFSPYQSLHPMANIFSGNFIFSSSPTISNNGLENSISLIFQAGGQLLENQSSIASLILGALVLGIPAIVVIVFEYVMALRPFVVSLLAAVSPIAFASFILPQTQVFFKKWLQYLLIALFYPLAVNFVFYFLNLIEVSGSNPVPFFAQWAFKIFAIIVLIRLPFKITSDVAILSSKLSTSPLGQSLGLNKAFPSKSTTAEGLPKSDDALKANNKMAQVVAPKRNFLSKISQNTKNETSFKKPRTDYSQNLENLGKKQNILMSQANDANLQRSPEMIKNSISDLSLGILKSVAHKSDMQIWRDTRLIEQLKNQDGRILDEQGAALRADSVRKAIRLSQLSENGELVNKDLIEHFASKGALALLPQETIRRALEQKIISQNDLASSFGKNYKLENRDKNAGLIEKDRIRGILDQDRLDYSSGFNFLKNQIDEEADALLPKGKITGDEIAKNFLSEANVSRENLPHVTKRLKEEENSSIAKLSSAISSAGVEKKTALALAQNKQISPAQIAKYLPDQSKDQQTLKLISQQVAKRDLNSAVSSKINETVSAQEFASAAAITQKLSSVLKENPQLKLDEISKMSSALLEKTKGDADEAQISPLVSQIEKFHPAMQIETATNAKSKTEIAKKKAQEVSETIEVIRQAGFNEDDVKSNPALIMEKIKKFIYGKNDSSKSDANSPVKKDSTFDSELSKISSQS